MTKQEKKEQNSNKDTEIEKESKQEEKDSEVELLQKDDEIRRLQEQLANAKENYLRSVADTENLRKRLEKEVSDSKKFALSSFSKDLINVVENLYRSTEHITEEHKKNETIKQIFDGIEMTQSELEKVMKKYGLERVNPHIGDKFDHNFHQAVSTVKDEKHEPNTIMNIIEAGYMLQGRLIRPSLVVVNNI